MDTCKVEQFHDMVWKRFVRMPYGHVLDYAGKNGEAYFPTAEECQKSMPNPRSWGLPIENGGFFTGLYAYALIEKYNKTNCPQTAEEIRLLMKGLYLLQDVAKVEGFIARGVGDDGVSHYPMGAECQTFPWVLALYAYYKSALCEDKDAVKNRLLRVLFALRDSGWNVPCDEAGMFYRTNWTKAIHWRGVVMFLFCSRLIGELTREEKELALFDALMESKPENCVFTRREIISQGYASDMITSFGNQTWICTYTHLAVRELIRLDAAREADYRRCLYNNGVIALRNANSIKKYDNAAGGFDLNWRVLNELWEDYGQDTNRGTAIASRQFDYWHAHTVPHRKMEHSVLGNALFAMWVAITSEDARIAKHALHVLQEECVKVDWDAVHLSYAFVVESAMIFGDQYLDQM